MANIKYQNELAQIDREWEIERQQYLISFRGIRFFGRIYIPTVRMGIGMAVLGSLFGTLWTIIALSVASQSLGVAAFSPAKVFLLIGVIFTVVFVSYGVYCYSRAKEYQKAFKNYMARRQQIRPEQFD